jgi:acetolactate synthase-1/2/3 large subunit
MSGGNESGPRSGAGAVVSAGLAGCSGSDRIAARLAAAGCRFAFGIPGGEVLTLIDALTRAGIRFVTARHETAAGFMAEGTWHATGAPGILVATIGPGVSNAVNVIANAQQDRVPLVVLTGCLDDADRDWYTHQIFDHGAVLAPITKRSIRGTPGELGSAIDALVTCALDGVPGPVHLDVPIGLAAAPEPARPTACVSDREVATSADDLGSARRALDEAQRPIVLAGLEVITQGAEHALRKLVQARGLPIVTTYKAKGVVDEASPLALGAAGLSPRADALLLPLLRDADVVLLAGYDPIEMRRGWHRPFGPEARVIDVAADRPSFAMAPSTDRWVGDIALHLEALTTRTPRPTWADGRIARTRASLREAFAPEPSGLGPLAIVHALRRATSIDTVVTVDTGAHRIVLSQAWTCSGPRTLLQSSGLCTMGCALPLAIGHALADPSKPVLAVVGDGGLDMTLGELLTARDLGVPLVVVVIDDASLALIELKQRAEHLPNVGVDSGHTRYADIARAMGGHGVRVETIDELEREVREGLARRSAFTLVHAPIARRAYDGRI